MRGSWHRAAVAVAVAVAGLVGFGPPAGAATGGAARVPTYTWTGKAAMSRSLDANWSDAANWKGHQAPAAPGPVDLVFPPLTCSNTKAGCGSSNNDLTGLTVGKLTLDYTNTTYQTGAYYLSGNGITLGQLASDGSPYAYSSPSIGFPITIAGSETWTLDGSFLGFQSISGPGTLTISMGDLAQPSIFGTVSVGAFDIVGQDPEATGDASYANGYFDMQTGSAISSPLTVRDVFFSDFSSDPIGPLTSSGAGLSFSTTLPINGSGTLDPATVLYFTNLAPGSPAQEVTATGAIALNTAQLNLSADCGQATGTTYTLFSATGGVSGILQEDLQYGSQKIQNGTIIQAQQAYDGSCSGSNTTPPYLQFAFDDTAGTVTATVVAAP